MCTPSWYSSNPKLGRGCCILRGQCLVGLFKHQEDCDSVWSKCQPGGFHSAKRWGVPLTEILQIFELISSHAKEEEKWKVTSRKFVFNKKANANLKIFLQSSCVHFLLSLSFFLWPIKAQYKLVPSDNIDYFGISLYYFLNVPTPASFSFIFSLFNQTTQFLPQINVKCPSRIRHRDLNSQSSDYESPPLTTRPGLPPYLSSLDVTNKFQILHS